MKYDFLDIPNDELSTLIDRWIKGDRNRAILKRRLIDLRTYDELSAEFFLSNRQLIRIVGRAEYRLFSKINK